VGGLTRKVLDRARRSRDARFDGRFFIAVRSTRIYCRPICPSRLSNDSNINYYATAEEAAEAGYRPCLRCRPEAAPGSPAWRGTSAVVQRALRLIQEGGLDRESLTDLANRLGIGVRHLNRLFAKHIGASPATVAQTRRLEIAKRLLDDTGLSITEIALAAGFKSIRRFNDVFLATYRRSPRELRKTRSTRQAGKGAEITLRLAYRPPYDWEQVCGFLARHAISGVEGVSGVAYARAVRTPSGHAVIQVCPVARARALEVRIQGALPSELPRLLGATRRMFDLAADPAHIRSVLSMDPLLQPLVTERPGLRIAGIWDLFECAVRAVLAPKGASVATPLVLKEIVERLGDPIDTMVPGVQYLFPTASALAMIQDVPALGEKRGETIRRVARAFRDDAWELYALPDILDRLMDPCASAYVALRGLGEPDAFPSCDWTLRRMLSAGHEAIAPQALRARAESWRPFRGYAACHLWVAAAGVSGNSRSRRVD
jgi:AraC family transcriptional regulator of adaptative response / DNA-3-methyladenine glycosylase II